MVQEEIARVLRLDGDYAVVHSERHDPCMLCPGPDDCPDIPEEGCGVEFRVLNRIGAGEGDMVRLRLEGNQVLIATLLVYGVPLVFMLSGLGLALGWAAQAGFSGLLVQGLGAAGLLVALLASVPVSRRLDGQLYRLGTFTPVIAGLSDGSPPERFEV